MKSCVAFILLLSTLLSLSYSYIEFCEKSVFYLHNEVSNKLGSHRCKNSCDCDGNRTCSSWSWCSGDSRMKHANYYYNEKLSDSECDSVSPIRDYYCTGTRQCSPEGRCIDA